MTCKWTEYINTAEICGELGELGGVWVGDVVVEFSMGGGFSSAIEYFVDTQPLERDDFWWDPTLSPCLPNYDMPDFSEDPTPYIQTFMGGIFDYAEKVTATMQLSDAVEPGDTVDWAYEVMEMIPPQSSDNYVITVQPQGDVRLANFIFESLPSIKWVGYISVPNPEFDEECEWPDPCAEENITVCSDEESPDCTTRFSVRVKLTAIVSGKGIAEFYITIHDTYNCV